MQGPGRPEAQLSAAPRLAFYLWHGTFRRTWRGDAGHHADQRAARAPSRSAPLAGARRTDSAYGRYLTYIRASDAFVNVPGQVPGVPISQPIEVHRRAARHRHRPRPTWAWTPTRWSRGRVVDSFVTDSMTGSYALPHIATSYFSQDRMTVLGRPTARPLRDRRDRADTAADRPAVSRRGRRPGDVSVLQASTPINVRHRRRPGRARPSRWPRSWTSHLFSAIRPTW